MDILPNSLTKNYIIVSQHFVSTLGIDYATSQAIDRCVIIIIAIAAPL